MTSIDPKTSPEIEAFLAKVTPAKRLRDARTLLALYERATGLEAKLHGTIIGYGQYEYRYDSGHEGRAARVGGQPLIEAASDVASARLASPVITNMPLVTATTPSDRVIAPCRAVSATVPPSPPTTVPVMSNRGVV